MEQHKCNLIERLDEDYIQRIERRYGAVIKRDNGDILVYDPDKDGPRALTLLYGGLSKYNSIK